MYFTNLETFIDMGGHGLYVWLSYGVGLVIFFIAFISPIVKRKRIIKELSQIQRRHNNRRQPSIKIESID